MISSAPTLLAPSEIGFVRSPLPPALGIAGIVTTALVCAGVTPRPSVVVMVLCLTYASYTIDRVVDESDAGRSVATWLVRSALLAFTLALALATWHAGPGIAALAGLFPLAVAGYCMPWLAPWFGERGVRRAKDLPYAKNLYTAFCVGLSALWAAEVSGARGTMLVCAGVIALVQEFVNTAACDLADVEDDRRRAVPTFAARWGVVRTCSLLASVSALGSLGLAIGATTGLLAPAAGFVAITGLLVQGYLVALRGPASPTFTKLAPDVCDAAIGLLALLAWLISR